VGFLLGVELPCLCENMGKPMGKPRKKLLWTVQVKQSHKVEKTRFRWWRKTGTCQGSRKHLVRFHANRCKEKI
jgi:hypothetical protein